MILLHNPMICHIEDLLAVSVIGVETTPLSDDAFLPPLKIDGKNNKLIENAPKSIHKIMSKAKETSIPQARKLTETASAF